MLRLRFLFAAAAAAIPAPLRGGLWIVVSTIFFALTAVIIRHVSAEVDSFEIAFFRNLFGVLFMMPWLMKAGVIRMRTRRLGHYGLRALAATGAQLCWFTAVTIMPLADATALNFTSPLFAVIGAALILGETVGPRRAAAVFIGFVGAAIILRPGIEAFTPAAAIVLAASLFQALAQLAARSLSSTESPNLIVLYLSLMMTPLTGIAASLVWVTPSWQALGWLAVMGFISTLGQQALVRGFRAAEASVVAPFNYGRMVFAAVLAYIFFGEVADIWTWVGATVIFGATVYTARRETQVRRSKAASGPAEE